MSQVYLEPSLSSCIETEAKREFQNTLRKLLAAGEGNEELEEKVEILRIFLETADFKELRRQSETHLVADKRVRFVIYLDKGTPKYNIQVA